MGGEGGWGVLEFCLRFHFPFLLVTKEHMQSFKIVAFLLLTDSGGYVKFTPKYVIVGVKGGH